MSGQTGDCPKDSGQIPFVLPNPQPLNITHEVDGADMIVHVNYTENLITGTSPTLINWTVSGFTVGGNPDSIDVLANEIKLTYLADSVTGTVLVSQTAIDDEAKTTAGIQTGTYTDITST